MFTLGVEYNKADLVADRLLQAAFGVAPQDLTVFKAEWAEIDHAIDDALTKARALRDKIAAMEEG